VVGDRDGRPQEDPQAVQCFCVCSGSALLGDLLGVSRSVEHDLLSVLSIYPRIFLCIFIVYRRMLMCVGCFGLVVSTCQVIGYRKTPLRTPSWGEEILPQSPGGRACVYVFFFHLVCLCCYVFPPGPTQYIVHKPMARYSLYVLKVPLNTKQTNNYSLQRVHVEAF